MFFNAIVVMILVVSKVCILACKSCFGCIYFLQNLYLIRDLVEGLVKSERE